jgi:RNA polymerase sigma factor for flagellar operon FliA
MSRAAAARHESPATVAVEDYVPLIRRVATRLARRLPAHVALDDLISAGVIGLLDSATRFDPSRAEQFDTFAEFRVRGAMLDELRATDSLTRDMRQHMNELRAAVHRLEGALGRAPSEEEIAAELGLSLDGYYAMVANLSGHTVASLDELGAQDAVQFAAEAEDPCEAAARAEARQAVVEAIDELPERERAVLRLYYFAEMTLKEIGAALGVTESRVCQIHTQATRALRERLLHLVG